jgi:Rrf2 family protein
LEKPRSFIKIDIKFVPYIISTVSTQVTKHEKMRLSTKGCYGTRAMLDLAVNFSKNPVLLRDIAKRQGLSQKYLEQLISALRKAGLVRSIRGARGGYVLAKPPSEIRLSEIMDVLEGSMAPVDCVDDPQVCSRASFCVTRDIWVKVKEAIDNIFESITLQELVEKQENKLGPKILPYDFV